MEREVEKIAPDSVPEYNSCDQELMKALAKNIGGIDELDMWTELKENMPDSKLLELCKMCRLDIKEDSILQELHDDFIKQYPMLEFVDAYEINKSNKETIAKYINGVEKWLKNRPKNHQNLINIKARLNQKIGHVKNLSQIDANRLWNDYFRINAWTSTYGDDCVVKSSRIEKSFFVCYREGVIIDKTIQPEPTKEKFF